MQGIPRRIRPSRLVGSWSPLLKRRIILQEGGAPPPAPDTNAVRRPFAKALFGRGLFRLFQYLKWARRLALLLLVVMTFIVMTSAMYLHFQEKRLFIDRIELPEKALMKGVTPARVELVLQTAVEQMLAAVTLSQVEAMRVRSRGHFGLANEVVSGRAAGVEVSIGGNVFAAHRVAFWLATTLGLGPPQTLVTVHAAEVSDGKLDVMLSARRSDGTSGSIRLSEVFPADDYLDPDSIWAQTVAMHIIEMHDPKRGFELAALADMLSDERITPRTISAYYRVAPRLSGMETFQLLSRIDAASPFSSWDMDEVMQHAELRHPDAPWDAMSGGFNCKGADKALYALAEQSNNIETYPEAVRHLLANCIRVNRDVDTLKHIGTYGVHARQSHKHADTVKVARLIAISSDMKDLIDLEQIDEFLQVAGTYLAKGATDSPGYQMLGEYLASSEPPIPEATAKLLVRLQTTNVEEMLQRCRNLAAGRASKQCELKAPEEMAANFVTLGDLSLTIDKNYGLAGWHCSRAASLTPNDPLAALCMSRAYLLMNNIDDALTWLKKAEELADPLTKRLIPNISMADREHLRRLRGWLTHLIGGSLESVDDSMWEGTFSGRRGQLVYWLGASTCTDGIGLNQYTYDSSTDIEKLPPWIVAMSGRKYLEGGHPVKARQMAGRLLQFSRGAQEFFNHEDPTDQLAYEGHLLMGTSLLMQGHFEQALVALEKAVAIRSYAAEALVLREMAKDRYVHPGHRRACTPLSKRYADTPYSRIWTDPESARWSSRRGN